jgi:putative copper resistance protein D
MVDPLVLARAVHLLATMLVAGTVFFDVVVLAPALAREGRICARLCKRSRVMIAGGLALAIVSGAAWFGVLAASLSETGSFRETAWTLAIETQFGIAWMLRLGLAVVIAASLARPNLAIASRWRTGLNLGASAALAGTLAWSGHGAATPGAAGSLHTAADALHAIAAAAWLGGLLPLAFLLGWEGRNDDLGLPALVMAVRRFSALGVAAVATLIISGIVNTLFAIDRVEALWTSAYGRALLVKILFFAGMLIFAMHNRQTLTPELAKSTNTLVRSRATHRLCVNSVVEITLGVAIIGIVAWLGVTEPAGSGAHMH